METSSSEYIKLNLKKPQTSSASMSPADYLKFHVGELSIGTMPTLLENISDSDLLDRMIPKPSSPSSRRSPILVPNRLEPFALPFFKKQKEGLFLGTVHPQRPSNQRAKFSRIRMMANHLLSEGESSLEPSKAALLRTTEAIKHFFRLSYDALKATPSLNYPLAGKNKCLGMVVVPKTRLVLVAISQDKDPQKDIALRTNMMSFLSEINALSRATENPLRFELVCIPTQAQYLLPRTLFMRTPYKAPRESIDPHTRCVEVALMAALNKAGRNRPFTATETGVIAFGSSLWESQTGENTISTFGETGRNMKHAKQGPIEVIMADGVRGWVDEWNPCKEHCAIYKYEMLAIGVAGGDGTSFTEGRSEDNLAFCLPCTALRPG